MTVNGNVVFIVGGHTSVWQLGRRVRGAVLKYVSNMHD